MNSEIKKTDKIKTIDKQIFRKQFAFFLHIWNATNKNLIAEIPIIKKRKL